MHNAQCTIIKITNLMRITVGSVALVAPIDVKVPFTSMHTTKLNVCTKLKYNIKICCPIVGLFKNLNLHWKMISVGTPEIIGATRATLPTIFLIELCAKFFIKN